MKKKKENKRHQKFEYLRQIKRNGKKAHTHKYKVVLLEQRIFMLKLKAHEFLYSF